MNADGSNQVRFTTSAGGRTSSPPGRRTAPGSPGRRTARRQPGDLLGQPRRHGPPSAHAQRRLRRHGARVVARRLGDRLPQQPVRQRRIFVVSERRAEAASGSSRTTRRRTTSPTWSPDGSRIAFDSSRSGNEDVWSVGSGGGEQSPRHTRPTPAPTGSRRGRRTAPASRSEPGSLGGGGGAPQHLDHGPGGTEAGPVPLTSARWSTTRTRLADGRGAAGARIMSPGGVVSGSPDVAVIVEGSGFVRRSQVRWNGQPRSTKFVSPTRLTSIAPASDLTRPGARGSTWPPRPSAGASRRRSSSR